MSNSQASGDSSQQGNARQQDGHDPELAGMLFEAMEETEAVFGQDDGQFNEAGQGVDLGNSGGLDQLLQDGDKPKQTGQERKAAKVGARPKGKKPTGKPAARQQPPAPKQGAKQPAAKSPTRQPQPQPQPQAAEQAPPVKPEQPQQKKGFWARLLAMFGLGRK